MKDASRLTWGLVGTALVLPLAAGVLAARAGLIPPEPDASAFLPSPIHEQILALAAFFGIKAIYTFLTAILLVKLWRRRERDLAACWWALLAFFVGEAMCAVNVLGFGDRNPVVEYLHATGMVVFLAFLVHAVLVGLDTRLVHYSNGGHCGMSALCRGCVKHTPAAACGLRRGFLLLIPAAALLAALPFTADLQPIAYTTKILGGTHVYEHAIVNQWYEFRFLPVAAMVLFALAELRLAFWEKHPATLSRILFAAGIGALGFSLLRLIMFVPFVQHQAWFAAWEELTELLLIGLIYGIFFAFPGLLKTSSAEPARAAAAAKEPA